MLTDAQIEEIRADAFADDIEPLLPEMYSWSLEEVVEYFESNGEKRPTPKNSNGEKRPQPKYQRWNVVFAPRIAVRQQPSPDAKILGMFKVGETLSGAATADNTNWVKIDSNQAVFPGGFVMITHPEHGKLLEPVTSSESSASADPPAATGTTLEKPQDAPAESGNSMSLKKTFEKKIGRKACGSNLKTADAAGASRDSLFDHFVEQARAATVRRCDAPDAAAPCA